jgi:hypothetical protein
MADESGGARESLGAGSIEDAVGALVAARQQAADAGLGPVHEMREGRQGSEASHVEDGLERLGRQREEEASQPLSAPTVEYVTDEHGNVPWTLPPDNKETSPRRLAEALSAGRRQAEAENSARVESWENMRPEANAPDQSGEPGESRQVNRDAQGRFAAADPDPEAAAAEQVKQETARARTNAEQLRGLTQDEFNKLSQLQISSSVYVQNYPELAGKQGAELQAAEQWMAQNQPARYRQACLDSVILRDGQRQLQDVVDQRGAAEQKQRDELWQKQGTELYKRYPELTNSDYVKNIDGGIDRMFAAAGVDPANYHAMKHLDGVMEITFLAARQFLANEAIAKGQQRRPAVAPVMRPGVTNGQPTSVVSAHNQAIKNMNQLARQGGVGEAAWAKAGAAMLQTRRELNGRGS